MLIIIGAIINYAAGPISQKMNLTNRIKVDKIANFTEDELNEYILVKARVRVKIVGLLILLPGVLLLFYLYR